MELRHLRYFVAVAAAGSFTRAASRLGVTQPALSRQVHRLEADLRVTLFERIRDGIRLTSDGEELLRESLELLSAAERLGDRVRRAHDDRTGVLRVAAGPQTMESVPAPFLAGYLKAWPDVEVHLMEARGPHLGQLVERGDAHVGIGVFRHGEHLQSCLLFPVRLLAVMVPRHRRRRRAAMELEELQHERVLLYRRGFVIRELFDHACRIARVHPRVVVEAGDAQSLVALTEAGGGSPWSRRPPCTRGERSTRPRSFTPARHSGHGAKPRGTSAARSPPTPSGSSTTFARRRAGRIRRRSSTWTSPPSLGRDA